LSVTSSFGGNPCFLRSLRISLSAARVSRRRGSGCAVQIACSSSGWLYRLLPSLLEAAVVFKPETLVRWHRSGFRLYWRCKSRRRVGRPAVPAMNAWRAPQRVVAADCPDQIAGRRSRPFAPENQTAMAVVCGAVAGGANHSTVFSRGMQCRMVRGLSDCAQRLNVDLFGNRMLNTGIIRRAAAAVKP
jgi:hypothetical protein